MKLKVRDLDPNPNCVLLHGWGVNTGVFTHLCNDLPAYLRVRLIDLPGFGRNNHIDISQLDFEHLAQLLLAAVPEKSVLIGWSLGGLFTQKMALIAPERFAAMIQICSSPMFVAQSNWHGIKPEVLQQFQSQLKDDHAKTIDRFLAIQAMGSSSAKNDIKQIRELVAENGTPHSRALEKGLHFLKSIDLRDSIGANTVPTLRIYGAKDSLVPVKNLSSMIEICPSSEKQVIESASHAPFISHKEDFISVMDKYLSNSSVDIP